MGIEMENVKDNYEQRRALVSSLADGQLRGTEFARAVGLVSDSGEARATWHAYHVVGDVLRGGAPAACSDDAAFVARFQARLQRETAGQARDRVADGTNARHAIAGTAPNDTKNIANNVYSPRVDAINDVESGSASDSRFRWKLLAGVASFAAVGAIGWNLVGGVGNWAGGSVATRKDEPTVAAQLAQTPVQAQSQQQSQLQPQVMIRDPRLDALLAAHKQFGGTSALQMPAGFLRNATFESPAR